MDKRGQEETICRKYKEILKLNKRLKIRLLKVNQGKVRVK
jgi:hypothetical protein